MNESGTVSFFVPTSELGGAERVIANLARGSVGRGKTDDLILGRAKVPYLADLLHDICVVELGSAYVWASFSEGMSAQ